MKTKKSQALERIIALMNESFDAEDIMKLAIAYSVVKHGVILPDWTKEGGNMTNREAAIKSCKDRLEHLENAPSHHCGKRQRQRAIELEKVKIEALRPVTREQVEKVWKGEWIGIPNMGVYDIACSKCGYSTGIRFWSSDFCPNCGAPMTDEAVDMVMERMEEVQNDQ